MIEEAEKVEDKQESCGQPRSLIEFLEVVIDGCVNHIDFVDSCNHGNGAKEERKRLEIYTGYQEQLGSLLEAEKVEDSGSEADFGTKDKQESWEDTYFGRVVNDISITDDYCLPPIKKGKFKELLELENSKATIEALGKVEGFLQTGLKYPDAKITFKDILFDIEELKSKE